MICVKTNPKFNLVMQRSYYYSVHYKYIGKKVRIIYTKDTVEIYFKQQRIAVHKRHRNKYGYTTDPLHMPSTHRYMSEWNPDKFLNWAKNIGPHCKTLISLLLVKSVYSSEVDPPIPV